MRTWLAEVTSRKRIVIVSVRIDITRVKVMSVKFHVFKM
jgi:hypothetical protein